jgi:uncharacterized surface protein with fasciclin (FAS1) repeats
VGRATIKRLVRDPVVVTGTTGAFSIATGNEYIGELSANSAWTFADTSSENGESVEFTNYSAIYVATLTMPAGTLVDGVVTTSFSLHGGLAGYTRLRFTRIGGVWHRQHGSNSGRTIENYVVGANANTTYSPTSVNYVHVASGGISAARDYTVSDTGATDGDHIRFECHDSTYQINVNIPGPSTCSIGASLTYQVVEARRMGGVWRFSLAAHLPT